MNFLVRNTGKRSWLDKIALCLQKQMNYAKGREYHQFLLQADLHLGHIKKAKSLLVTTRISVSTTWNFFLELKNVVFYYHSYGYFGHTDSNFSGVLQTIV